MNLDRLYECKKYIRGFNTTVDVTEVTTFELQAKTYKWVDQEAKELCFRYQYSFPLTNKLVKENMALYKECCWV